MLRTLSRLAFGKGILGGSKPWFYVGVAVTGLRLLGRMAKREPEVVYSETLDAGHTLLISHLTRDKA